MGNIIITKDIFNVTDAMVTMRTEDTNYPDEEMLILEKVGRTTRADDNNTNNYLAKINMGSAQSIAAVALDHVNFDKVHIHGHASDIWDGSPPYSPTFDSGEISISQCEWTGRYKVEIPLTAFSYQWLAFFIPSGASAVGDYTTKWQVGRFALLTSATALTVNMSSGYRCWVEHDYVDGRNGQRVQTGDFLQWVGEASFESTRTLSQAQELRTLSRMDKGNMLIFYENLSDTSQVFFCHRDDDFQQTRFGGGDLVTGNTIRFREVIK